MTNISLTRSRARRDQVFASVLGAFFLAISILLRPLLASQRTHLVHESENSLRSLAVNFPRLTLGGFRGLLATWLWISAEDDKQERRWVQLETKYDIIGSLQPYFISVYIFHAWNQAYNLSAQWHDQDAKYKWVLDGLAYLNKGEDYNPQNPDILVEQGNMYFLKLGGSFERIFYRAHWRDDMTRFWQLKYANPPLPASEKTEALKLVRDIVFRVSPENRDAYDRSDDPIEKQKLRTFHTADLLDPSGRTTRTGFGISIIDPFLFEKRTDGKLPSDPFPFRYGVSPYYFSYVEFLRVGNIARTQHIFPTTTTMRIVGAWPAMSLRLWCRDDLYHAQKAVAELFGPDDLAGQVQSPAALAEFNHQLADIDDCYRNVSLLAPKAVELFDQHLAKDEFKMDHAIHDKHIKETQAYQSIALAESQLFAALRDWNAAGRKTTAPGVADQFLKALALYQSAIQTTTLWVDFIYPEAPGQIHNPERDDFAAYVSALVKRKEGIENILRTQPPDQPDMNFLTYDTVEK